MTKKGERIRLKLKDKSFKDTFGYIHLPERLIEHIIKKIEKFNELCKQENGLHVIYNGLKGQAFDLTFKKGPF